MGESWEGFDEFFMIKNIFRIDVIEVVVYD